MQPSSVDNSGHEINSVPSWQAILQSIASGQYTENLPTRVSNGSPRAERSTSRPRLTIRINHSSNSAPLQPEQASAISSAIIRHLTRRTGSSQASSASPSPVPAPAPDAEDETTAAAAERHRLTSNSLVDLQAIAQWIESSLPYLGILGTVFLYHHCAGLFLFLWLLGGIIKTNTSIKQQIAQRRDYRISELLGSIAYVVINALAVVYLTAPEKLWRYLLLMPPTEPFTVWDVLFTVVVLDSLVRFTSSLPKVLAVAAFSYGSSGRAATRQQARLLTMMEYTSQMYRGVLAVPLWFHYLLRCTPNGIICSVCSGVYLTLKGSALLQLGKLMLTSIGLMFRRGAQYGTPVCDHDVMEAGGVGGACPICQDTVTNGVRLECSHIFCEECIGEWLERDRTCPMCRANIKPPGLQSYSDGTTSLLPQVF